MLNIEGLKSKPFKTMI